ncbi:protein naked cuticle homolog 2 isoform X3 [Sciurus carolinensis]|uniref:protein naked cuticle homolog 2 isoform X3 n=1 Tax=Sciurus carolinensis TaxID=30640 RepID=UPI001FB3DFEA|nr:protein naked cuticle homolog 2 isoform X3 [Sciurus carolinensis]
MGKFQSKHAATACKRRESPEGDSFVVSASASGRKGAEEVERRAGGGVERRAQDKQELPSGDPKDGPFREDQGLLEALPSKKAEGRECPGQLFGVDAGERAANREGLRGLGRKHLNIDQALQCDVSVEEDNRQEWTFTLYDFDNSGKVTREDMSSLMHTIYEVVGASVNHSSGSSKALRVKLTVSPEPASKRKECPPASQDWEPSRSRTEIELAEDARVADKRLSAHLRPLLSAPCRRPSTEPQPCPVQGPYCVDENTERRNHYLDLAGIENYTSKSGPGLPEQARQAPQGRAAHLQSRSHSQGPDTHAAHHRRSQVLTDHTVPVAEPMVRVLDMQPRLKGQEKQFLRSPKGPGKPLGLAVSSKPGKVLSYYLPATPTPQATQDGPHLPQPPPQPPPQPFGHKRHRQKGREGPSPLKAPHSQPLVEPEAARELPPMPGAEACVAPMVQRHEHQHQHQHHHHHHHHHHFLPS